MALSAAAYGFSVPGTGGYRAVDPLTDLPPARAASLDYQSGEPVISGTVAALFETPVFSGVNRTDKTDRARPEVNLVAFSQAFDAVRLSIAAARDAGNPYVSQSSSVMVAENEETPEEGPRISVAAADPGTMRTDGLAAIDAFADGADVDPTIPRPAAIPETLAYGRSTTPATDFTPKHTYSEREQWCLSTGIYFEARGESYRGQVAVAQTIMNRVEHPNYPDTICGVVYQNQHRRNACQFSFACDGIPDRINEPSAWAKAQEITQSVLNREIYLTEVADATHYHATYVRPHWARNMDKVTQVGLHVFYKFKAGWRFG
ncbi:cell wall hydrolase [Pelagibacterium sp. 26DY04]|uniref:cell wall hydrolase n=1 Tax=unclassified Pelagibacterium TaxID=2623280 RepID=UPI002814F45B|nr:MULTISPECIES: cell wall hydrolase [unclassified Pelagibacterium]WMT87892.1 cell wall hydrolase [Pelagibacterium sp. 26DY04]WMT91339.1 cell wall hydrolase [Pelagibacterium sp. H642]